MPRPKFVFIFVLTCCSDLVTTSLASFRFYTYLSAKPHHQHPHVYFSIPQHPHHPQLHNNYHAKPLLMTSHIFMDMIGLKSLSSRIIVLVSFAVRSSNIIILYWLYLK
ncbi:hypothetical protein DL96DRAFT_1280908 [Flagelloscypha sp. PMI_526]|nr:hypothetical protein DL96DRAFT_1280908 [Flagelloscypha sp. PMI_526]